MLDESLTILYTEYTENEGRKGLEMANKFVKEVVKRELVEVIDGSGPDCTFMSVEKRPSGSISLVIGAQWHNRCAYGFSKEGLADLIETLKEIHEVM